MVRFAFAVSFEVDAIFGDLGGCCRVAMMLEKTLKDRKSG